jgi:hypothetical protein
MVPQRDTTYPSFRRRRTELMSHLWRDLCQGNGCVDRRLHGRQIAGFTFLVLVDGWMWEEIYALEWCNVVVVVMRTQCVAATTRGKICVETREGKDEMYLDAIVMREDHGECIKGNTRGRRCGEGTQP